MPTRPLQEYYSEQRSDRSFAEMTPTIDSGVGLGAAISGPAFEQSFIGKTVMSMADNLYWESMPDQDPDYDPYDSIIADGLAGYADDLLQSRSETEYLQRKNRIASSLENRQILAESGMAGFGAQMAWGLVDPVNFAPVYGTAIKTLSTSKNLLTSAGKSAMVGGGSQIGQEAVLSQIDPTYDEETGALAVAANTLLSGLLGPAVLAATTPQVRADLRAGIINWGKNIDKDSAESTSLRPSTTGAMEVQRGLTNEEMQVAGSLKTYESMKFLNRVTRMQNSPFNTVRNVNGKLNRTALLTEGNLDGVASHVPAEVVIGLFETNLANSKKKSTRAFMDYRKKVGAAGSGVVGDIQDVFGVGLKKGVLTNSQFNERVAMAMRRGDKDVEGNEFVERAAAANREFFDAIEAEFVRLGIWSADKAAKDERVSYFSRVYDDVAINQDPEALRFLFSEHYKELRNKAKDDIGPKTASVDQKKLQVKNLQSDLDVVRQVARDSVANSAEENMTIAVNEAIERMKVEGGPPPIAKKTQEQAQKQAAAKGLKKRKEVLLEELSKDLDESIEEAMAGVLKKISDDAVESGDEIDAEDYISFIKTELTSPMSKQGGVSAAGALNDRVDAAVVKAIEEQKKTMKRSLSSQLSRMEKETKLSIAEIDKKIIDKIRNDIRLKSMAAAQKAAAEAAPDIKEQLKKSLRELKELQKDLRQTKISSEVDDDYLDSDALTTVNRIQGSPAGIVDYDRPDASSDVPVGFASKKSFRGAAKSRKVKIDERFQREYNGKVIKYEDFLVNDPDQIMRRVFRQVVPDLVVYEKLGGTFDLQKTIREATDEANKLIVKETDPAKRVEIKKRLDNDLKDISDSVDFLRGTLGQPDDFFSPLPTALRMAKQLNYLRLMGEMTVGSLADVGSAVLSEGIMRTFGTSVKLLASNLSKASPIKAAKEELQSLVVASESVLNANFLQLTDFDVYGPTVNKIESAGNYLSGKFQKITLMNKWMDGWRSIVGLNVQDRIIKSSLEMVSGDISKINKGRLASSYIDEKTAAVIKEQFETHGEIVDGLRVPNLRKWDADRPEVYDALNKIRAGIRKDIDTTIIRPGSDKPTWMSNWLLSPIGQFKSFGMSSTNSVLMKAGQRLSMGDLQAINGIATMIGFGMLSYYIKAALQGREVSDDPKVWVSEGIDKSGVLGILSDMNNMTEKITGHNIGLRPALGIQPASRYMSRNYLETLLGPTAGLVQDIGELAGPLSERNLTQSDIHKIRRMTPFQNTLGVRYLFDLMEEGIVSAAGIPEQRR